MTSFFQVHETHLKLSFLWQARTELDPRFEAKFPLQNSLKRAILMVLLLGLESYLEDMKLAITMGVRGSLSDDEPHAGNRLNDHDQSACLERWLPQAKMSSFDPDEGSLIDLIGSMVSNVEEARRGLPPGKQCAKKITYHDLSSAFLRPTFGERPQRAGAPYFSRGNSLSMMRTISTWLIHHCSAGREETETYMTEVLALALRLFKVRYIPWFGDSNRGYAKWNSWAYIDTAELALPPASIVPRTFGTASAIRSAIGEVLQADRAEDPTGEWRYDEFSLSDLHLVFKKACPPVYQKDSLRRNPSAHSEAVHEYYLWAQNSYDHSNSAHQMCLVISVILSQMVPFTTMDTSQLSSNLLNITDRPRIRHAWDQTPWKTTTNLKRNAKSINAIGLAYFTLGLSLLEPKSPLRETMSHSARNGLGAAWTAKHSTLSLHLANITLRQLCHYRCNGHQNTSVVSL
jgi:hypothetical protein